MAASIAVSLAALFYASWSDYKTREVSNRVWAIYAPIALSISLLEIFLFGPSQFLLFGVSVGITVGIAFLLFYSGGFGGADSKALMCLAVALPFAPQVLLSLSSDNLSPISQYIFPITIFSNAVLFAAASGVYMILKNVFWHRTHNEEMFAGALSKEAGWKKFLVLITGYKVTVEKLKEKWHVFPMEDIDDKNEAKLERKLVVIPHDEGRNEIVNRLSTAIEAKKINTYVWATPGLPMLIFITAGLIVALLFGDIVWLLMRFLLH